MNNDFTADSTEKEQDHTVCPPRRPLRRARRTVAPFTKENSLEHTKENKEEAVLEAEANEIPEADADSSLSTEENASPVDETTEEAEVNETVTDESAEGSIREQKEASAETFEENGEESQEEEEQEEEKEEQEEEEEKEEKLSPIAETFDWIKSFLFSLTVVIFIFTLIFRGVTVNGGSMLPTLENGEYLIISDLLYTPKNGDIVVVQSPHYKDATEPLIKRVIATGGQTVKINFTTWEVWVEGELLHEDYILRDGSTAMNCEDMKPDENGEVEFKVEDGCIFVMGDHRNDSLDSRSNSVGEIDERYIMGRVLIRLSPVERFGKVA